MRIQFTGTERVYPLEAFTDRAIEAARRRAERDGVLSVDPRTRFPPFIVYGGSEGSLGPGEAIGGG